MIRTWQTERLTATAVGPEHLRDMSRLHADSEVMQFLSSYGGTLTEEQTRATIEASTAHWDEHGFGLWAFHEQSSGGFVGRGGLKWYALSDLDGRREVGLAYAVLSSCWNNGFATEMARGALDVGFGQLGLDRIGSWALPRNVASQRVLEKLGFQYQCDFMFAGLVHKYYYLDRASSSHESVNNNNGA